MYFHIALNIYIRLEKARRLDKLFTSFAALCVLNLVKYALECPNLHIRKTSMMRTINTHKVHTYQAVQYTYFKYIEHWHASLLGVHQYPTRNDSPRFVASIFCSRLLNQLNGNPYVFITASAANSIHLFVGARHME